MKTRILSAALAAFFMLPFLGTTAFAVELDEPEEIIVVAETPAPEVMAVINENPVTDYPEAPPRPFTPSGTGTVVDRATDGDGKEFYTIMTPDENVFYLVIDRQRNSQNVYFLNAVTEADLLSLAKMPERPANAPVVTPQPPAPAEPEPVPAPAPEPGGGNNGMIFMVIAVVLVGGGAGWYFKIYKPKQQRAGIVEDYGASEADPYSSEELDDDSPPWYDDDEIPGNDSGADDE